MATSIVSRSFTLGPPDNFRLYKGPSKSQPRRAPAERRKADPSSGSPFIDIDEILPPDPELCGSGLEGNYSGEYGEQNMHKSCPV